MFAGICCANTLEDRAAAPSSPHPVGRGQRGRSSWVTLHFDGCVFAHCLPFLSGALQDAVQGLGVTEGSTVEGGPVELEARAAAAALPDREARQAAAVSRISARMSHAMTKTTARSMGPATRAAVSA